MVVGPALEGLSDDEEQTEIGMAVLLRRQRSRLRLDERHLARAARNLARQKSLQPVAPLSETILTSHSRARRCRDPGAPLPTRYPADMDSRTASHRPLHYLSSRAKGRQ